MWRSNDNKEGRNGVVGVGRNGRVVKREGMRMREKEKGESDDEKMGE